MNQNMDTWQMEQQADTILCFSYSNLHYLQALVILQYSVYMNRIWSYIPAALYQHLSSAARAYLSC